MLASVLICSAEFELNRCFFVCGEGVALEDEELSLQFQLSGENLGEAMSPVQRHSLLLSVQNCKLLSSNGVRGGLMSLLVSNCAKAGLEQNCNG